MEFNSTGEDGKEGLSELFPYPDRSPLGHLMSVWAKLMFFKLVQVSCALLRSGSGVSHWPTCRGE